MNATNHQNLSLRVVGNIAGFHGVRGEIKIFPLVDDPNIFKQIKEIFIEDPKHNQLIKYEIEKTRPHKKFVLIKLKNLDSLNAVENLKGHIKAPLNEELDDDEFYIEDLKGLTVANAEGKNIGKVKDIEDEGQTRIQIQLEPDFKAKRDLIVPFVKEYILNVDIKQETITINLTDDILDLAL